MTPGAPPEASNVRAVALILAAAALVIGAIGVRGDFPLSDDWSYAFATRALCMEGQVSFLPWTGASLVLQAWYGALLCRVLGFSFEILRLSTLALAASGAVGFFLLLGRAGIRGVPRALATALFALDPLYVNLAFTFMTDVPFTAVAVWAGYCYVRGLGERRILWLGAGAVLAAASLLIRQHGIFVAAAATLAALLAADRSPRERLADALAAGLVPVVTLAGFQLWLFAWHGAPGGAEMKLSEMWRLTPVGIINCAFRGTAYLGLLMAPLALAIRHDVVARRPRLVTAAAATLALLATALYLREGATMFYLTNVLYDLGLGALTLRDTLFLGMRPPVYIGPALGWPLTAVAVVAAGILLAAWVNAAGRLREPVPAFLLLASVLLFGGTLLHTRYYFDRYLLAVLPFALAAASVSARVRPSGASLALAAAFAWYAVAGTHDYLAWNRARHAGLAELRASGVAVTEIDGGMEFNAWHLAATLGTAPTDAEVRPGQPYTVKSWWWVVDDRFVASFRPLPGYVVRASLPYRRWLVPGMGRVVILERDNERRPDA